jgi:hypothetical protein
MGWFGGGCQGGAIGTFTYADFIAAYPAFASAPPQATLEAYFALAGEVWLRNDGSGPVRTTTLQTQLLYMLTAHLAQLFSGPDGNDPSGLVGRISSATEGSVTVATEYEGTMNSAFFTQTPYGAAFWSATSAFRSFPAYLPGPTRFGNGIAPGFGRRGRGCAGAF